MEKINKNDEKKFLELKQWNANHSSVWREIVSRFGQADYDDESIRTTREETLKSEWDAKQYQRDRLAEYPSIQELVVALYDESDKASIIERRNAVKAKYPKPE